MIDIFNARFFVPFTLTAKNKAAVILGDEPLLTLGFTFNDGAESASVDRSTLIQTLSTGEKKALYILNVIFEVEARRKAKQETVFVVDDIADSFDYKNKYAIIQYLKDIADEPIFKQILLTHNFDFFRTLNSRFVTYSHCLMSTKTSTAIVLKQAAGIQNIFVKDWKLHFFKEPKKKIASIPFIRNIIEYTKGDGDPDFITLTSLLHLRHDSLTITVGQLDEIFRRLFGSKEKSVSPKRPVIELIQDEAKTCLTAGAGINFENKIVLSVAIRLLAEAYMVAKINDPSFVNSILTNQTAQLLAQFKAMFADETAVVDVMMRVVLMTPENIHVNSFMYEPILDMSDEHLRKLYGDVAALH